MVDFYLKPNTLTQSANDYTAVVYQTDVFTEAELARDIAKTAGGITVGQVAQVLEAYTKCIAGLLTHGSNVKTGLFTTSFSIGGTFPGADADYNPAVNSTKLHFRPSAVLAAAAKGAARAKHAGVMGGPIIDAVLDMSTGDPNSTVHAGANARIVGSKVKLAGAASNVGISFMDSNGAGTPVPQNAISRNTTSAITFIVPPLPAGDYQVKVTTQFTGSTKQSGIPQSYTFPTSLTVPA